jgi:hypothetical protein
MSRPKSVAGVSTFKEVPMEAPQPTQGLQIQPREKPSSWEKALSVFLAREEEKWATVPLFERLRACLPWWEKHAHPHVVGIIKRGVGTDLPLPANLSIKVQHKTPQEIALATSILEDYQKSGAARRVWDVENSRHLIPWFVLSKSEGDSVKPVVQGGLPT